MKLEWMHLTNFRQFYGDHTIHFSRDTDQNVTVVNGANGSGKTSLFTALNWCLYDLVGENAGELVNKRAITEAAAGDDIEAKVQLAFSHLGERLTATRALSVTKSNNQQWRPKPQSEFSLDSIRSDGQTQRIPNSTGYVESILPSNVRTYFFFDGEKIDQFTRPSQEAEVEQAVRNVLKIEVLERAKTHLDAVAREYQSELRKHPSSGLQDLCVKEESLRDEVEDLKRHLAGLREEKDAAERQKREIDIRLGEIQEIREWDKQRKTALGEMKSREQEMDRLRNDLREVSNRGFFRFANGAVTKALSVLDAMRERGEIPTGIREQFVQDLLAAHRCICGRPIEEESNEHRQLMEVLARSVPSELEDAVVQTTADLRAVQPRVHDTGQQLRALMLRKVEINDELEKLNAKLDEVSRHLQGMEHEEVSSLERKRADYEQMIRRLAGDIGRFEERYGNRRSELNRLKDSIEKAHLTEERAQGIQRRFSLARKASDAVEARFEVFARDMRAGIQAKAKEIFQRLVWKESQFQDVRLTEDYQLEVIDRWGLPAKPELSAGERQVLSLAFITGMAKVTGEEAPLIMDTPFGRLSSAPREAITEHMPDITDQLIIFVTDEELRSRARSNLEPRIGAEYDLVFDQTTGTSTIGKRKENTSTQVGGSRLITNLHISRRDRVHIDPKHHELYVQLVTGNEAPFKTMKDLFMLAASVGFFRGRRLPLSGQHEIFRSVFTIQEDIPILRAIAISETGSTPVLVDQDQVLTIAEEYANAGIEEVRRQVANQPGRPLENLVQMLLSSNPMNLESTPS